LAYIYLRFGYVCDIKHTVWWPCNYKWFNTARSPCKILMLSPPLYSRLLHETSSTRECFNNQCVAKLELGLT
jgi:hypothetical protein